MLLLCPIISEKVDDSGWDESGCGSLHVEQFKERALGKPSPRGYCCVVSRGPITMVNVFVVLIPGIGLSVGVNAD